MPGTTSRAVCISLFFSTLAIALPGTLLAQDAPAKGNGWNSEWSKNPDPVESSEDPAESTPPIALGASLRPRVEARRVGTTSSETMSYRARLELTGRTGMLEGFFQPQASGLYGVTGVRNLNTPNLSIFQAYLRYGTDSLNVQAGRFQVTYGEEVVWSRAEWNQVGRASDGIRLHAVPLDGLEIDALASKYTNFPTIANTTLPTYGFDSFSSALIVQLKPELLAPVLKEADVYALRDYRTTLNNFGGPDRDRITAFGTRLTGKWSLVDAKLEVVGQVGDNCTLELTNDQSTNCLGDEVQRRGFMGETELGFALIDTLRLELGGIYASGDDEATDDIIEAYDPLYAAAHRHLGLADVFRRTDIFQARGGVTFNNKVWMFDAMVHHFWDAGIDPRGLEVDLTLAYTFPEKLKLQAGFSHLFPTTSDQMAVTWGYIQANAAFK